MKQHTGGAEARRRRYRAQGYEAMEIWLPSDVKRKLHAIKGLRGERGVNEVIDAALTQYVNDQENWRGSGSKAGVA